MTEKMLNTEAAAQYLQVSQASVRRWADAGLLPATRVGVRKARRFHEADLARFLGAVDRALPGAIFDDSTLTMNGRPVRVSSHLAGFYGSDSGRMRLGLPLLLDGLAREEPCLLFATPEIREHYVRALKQQHLDVEAAAQAQRFVTMAVRRDTPEAWIAKLETQLTEAMRRQAAPVRFVAEVTAGLKTTGSLKALLRQEQLLTPLVKRFPVVLLCLYDVREFDGPTILEALKLHYETFDQGFGYFLS